MVKRVGVVRAAVVLKGYKGSKECIALVDTGAALTVMDRWLADVIGVDYTGRKRTLLSVSGHRIEGEIAIVREMQVEGEVLDYEKVVAVSLPETVKNSLKNLGLDDSIIIGLTTVELANYMPDTSTGKLRKIETFLF